MPRGSNCGGKKECLRVRKVRESIINMIGSYNIIALNDRTCLQIVAPQSIYFSEISLLYTKSFCAHCLPVKRRLQTHLTLRLQFNVKV